MVRTRCPWSWYLWAREAMSCELKSIIPKASHENGWRSMAHSTRCIRSPEAGDSAGVASDWLRRRTSPVTSFPKMSKTSSKISSNQPTKALTMDSMESMEPAESALRLRRTWHGQGRGVISAGPIRLMLDSGSQQSHFWANLQSTSVGSPGNLELPWCNVSTTGLGIARNCQSYRKERQVRQECRNSQKKCIKIALRAWGNVYIFRFQSLDTTLCTWDLDKNMLTLPLIGISAY